MPVVPPYQSHLFWSILLVVSRLWSPLRIVMTVITSPTGGKGHRSEP